MGDVTDLSNFMGAVIDDRAFAKHKAAIARAKRNNHLTDARRRPDRRLGRLLRAADDRAVHRPDGPDVLTEYFGPILAVHVYDDAQLRAGRAADGVVRAVRPDRRDHRPGPRGHRLDAASTLRFAAGNFYINDKPTGAVVGQQPFGGARASGTNDKAGAAVNLLRWTSPAVDQGDVRARRRTTATPTWAECADALRRAKPRWRPVIATRRAIRYASPGHATVASATSSTQRCAQTSPLAGEPLDADLVLGAERVPQQAGDEVLELAADERDADAHLHRHGLDGVGAGLREARGAGHLAGLAGDGHVEVRLVGRRPLLAPAPGRWSAPTNLRANDGTSAVP